MSRFLRLDENHKEIVEHLKGNENIWVYDLCRVGSGITDLMITDLRTDITSFLEIKKPKKGNFKRSQIVFMSVCRAPVGFAKNKEDAMKFALDCQGHCLTKKQQEALKDLLKEDKSDTFRVSVIEELIGVI